MSIAEKLKSRTLELRKARDEIAPTFQFVLSDAKNQAIAKRIPEFTEDMAVSAINRAINQTKELLETAPNDVLAQKKLTELTALLPVKVSADEVRTEAMTWFRGVMTEAAPMAYMGEMMKHLMDKFGAALDRSVASQIAREVLGGK